MPSFTDPSSSVGSGPGRLSIGTGRAPRPGNDHYLVDLFTDPVASAPIVDVIGPQYTQTLVNGIFVVRVSSHIPLIDPATGNPSAPTNCGDLLSKKYQGLLTFYSPTFSHIAFDSLLNTSGLNLGVSGTSGFFGQRSTIALNPGSTITTMPVALGSTPTQALFTWEVFTYTDADPSTDRYTRLYNEVSTGSSSTAQVSLNNGSNFLSVTDSTIFAISGPNQGSTLIAKITNTTGSILRVGSWSLLY